VNRQPLFFVGWCLASLLACRQPPSAPPRGDAATSDAATDDPANHAAAGNPATDGAPALVAEASMVVAPAATALPSAAALIAAFRGTNARGFVGVTAVTGGGASRRVIAALGGGLPAPGIPIASFTKLWTAVAALRLVAAHRLALSDRVAELLPSLAGRPWADSTLAELMSHTSRVPEFDEASGFFSRRDVTFSDPVATLETHLSRTATEKRGVFKYKNAEYALVGAILATRAALPFPELLKREVFDPAKMSHSGLLVGAVPADVDARSLGTTRAQNFFAAGAGYSTPEDLLAFFEALSSDALLDEPSKALLFDGQRSRGYGALGCWAYPFGSADAGTTLLVERQGALGSLTLFAAFLPERRRAVVAWSSTSVRFDHPYLGHGVGNALAMLLDVR